MGQGKSALNSTPLYAPAEFEVSMKRNDQRYGNILPLKHKATGQELVVITKTLQEEEELRNRLAELDVREKLRHPNLVSLIRKNSKKQDDFCSTFFELGLLYEYWTGNLKNEISERCNVGIGFQEGELWYLADSLLSVVHYLKTESLTHSDIRPYNVMLTEHGVVKLGEVFMHTRSISAFSQLLNHQLDEHYISPQQFLRLRSPREALNQDYDINKSEIFTVGMTLLEAATLQDVSSICYDKINFAINFSIVDQLLEAVSSHYSHQFSYFLSKLLRESEHERAPIEELLLELQQPQIAQSKFTSIVLASQFQHNIQYQNEPAQQEEPEEKVLRSAKPAAVEEVFIAQTPAPVQNNSSEFDDLNARIQAVLAMSRDTIARYGTTAPTTITTTTTTTTVPAQTTTYFTTPAEAKASQIETRTYLNETTNTIETRVYPQYSNTAVQEQVEEVIKRSSKPQEPIQVTQSYAPAPVTQTYTPSPVTQTYTPAAVTTTTYQLPTEQVYTVPATSVTYSLPQQAEQVYTSPVPAQAPTTATIAPLSSYQPLTSYTSSYTVNDVSTQPQQTYGTATYGTTYSSAVPEYTNNNAYANLGYKLESTTENAAVAPAAYSTSTYQPYVPQTISAPITNTYTSTTTSYTANTYVPSVNPVTETKLLDTQSKLEQDEYIQKLLAGMRQQQPTQTTTTTYTTSAAYPEYNQYSVN